MFVYQQAEEEGAGESVERQEGRSRQIRFPRAPLFRRRRSIQYHIINMALSPMSVSLESVFKVREGICFLVIYNLSSNSMVYHNMSLFAQLTNN